MAICCSIYTRLRLYLLTMFLTSSSPSRVGVVFLGKAIVLAGGHGEADSDKPKWCMVSAIPAMLHTPADSSLGVVTMGRGALSLWALGRLHNGLKF